MVHIKKNNIEKNIYNIKRGKINGKTYKFSFKGRCIINDIINNNSNIGINNKVNKDVIKSYKSIFYYFCAGGSLHKKI